MYGQKQAACLVYDNLLKLLKPNGYCPVSWPLKTNLTAYNLCPMSGRLCVVVKYLPNNVRLRIFFFSRLLQPLRSMLVTTINCVIQELVTFSSHMIEGGVVA